MENVPNTTIAHVTLDILEPLATDILALGTGTMIPKMFVQATEPALLQIFALVTRLTAESNAMFQFAAEFQQHHPQCALETVFVSNQTLAHALVDLEDQNVKHQPS